MRTTWHGVMEQDQFMKIFSRWVLAGVILFVGIGGGVYTGLALSNAHDTPAASVIVDPADNQTNLEPGELFPNYDLRIVADSQLTSVKQLAEKNPVLLVFVSRTCSACDMLKGYWKKKVLPKVDPAVRVVFVYDATQDLPSVQEISMGGVTFVSTDRRVQQPDDGIASTPTIVGLTSGGTIKLIVTGYTRKFGSLEINALLD